MGWARSIMVFILSFIVFIGAIMFGGHACSYNLLDKLSTMCYPNDLVGRKNFKIGMNALFCTAGVILFAYLAYSGFLKSDTVFEAVA